MLTAALTVIETLRFFISVAIVHVVGGWITVNLPAVEGSFISNLQVVGEVIAIAVDGLRFPVDTAVLHVRLVVRVAEAARVGDEYILLIVEALVLVHLAEDHHHGREGRIGDEDEDIEPQEADGVDYTACYDGPEGVGERVGDVGDGVHRAVDGYMADVHEVAQHGQQSGVHEGDTEADAHDGEDDNEERFGERNEEAEAALHG